MAGMDCDLVIADEEDSQFLVGHQCRHAEDDIPPCIDLKTRDGALLCEQPIKSGQVRLAAGADLLLDEGAAGEPRRQGVLDGSVHGKVGVGDDLDAVEGGVDFPFRSAGDDPGSLHLRQARNFAKAAQDESESGMVCGSKALGSLAAEGIVEEDFIDDESEAAFGAKQLQLASLGGGGEVACGVVGMDQSDGAGARRDLLAKGRKVDVPAVVVEERVRNEMDITYLGQEVEKRIGGLGNEDFVAGVAKQPEEKAVCLAGAGGEDDLTGMEGCAVG